MNVKHVGTLGAAEPHLWGNGLLTELFPKSMGGKQKTKKTVRDRLDSHLHLKAGCLRC